LQAPSSPSLLPTNVRSKTPKTYSANASVRLLHPNPFSSLLLNPFNPNRYIDFTFAGQGSTAAALTTVLHDLALPSNADWQFQIRESLAALPFTISTGTTAPGINVSLQCFLRESWRLSPPFPAPFERVIARGAETSIPGLKGPLPVGTRVASNLYVIMRSKEVFGEDADVFRADRWMEGTDGERKRMEDAWAVFGRGSRACAGKEIAVTVVKMVIAEV
jgi:benzoate 4-monooxygenase